MIVFPENTYPGGGRQVQVYQRLLDALRGVPGVEAATAMLGLPPTRPANTNNTRVADPTIPSAGQFHVVDYYQFVREIDRAVPVVGLRDMETVFADSIQRPRFLAQLLGLFAGLALLLAAIGTYGVVSSIVAERRREIGIRMALVADRSSVLAGVMKEGLVLSGIGVVLGLSGAVALNRLIAALLFGVRPTDVSTAAGVAATMILVAAVACLLPAWRASRLDPSAVLRA